MKRRASGFTLVELVVTIAISGIIAGVVGTIIQKPMLAYQDVERRSRLVDAARNSLIHLEREVRGSLPNSLRITAAGTILEVIPVVDGGRYRRQPGVNPGLADHTAASDWLDFSGDASFNVMGRLQDLGFAYGAALPGIRLAIYNTNTSIYAAAATDTVPSVVTPSTAAITILDDVDEDQISLSGAFDFLLESPDQRFYLIGTPVTYRCDLAAGTFTRHSDYGFSATQPSNPAAAPLSAGSAARLADGISACQFVYTPGTSSRAGLLSLEISVAEGAEAVNLLHQGHVENAP